MSDGHDDEVDEYDEEHGQVEAEGLKEHAHFVVRYRANRAAPLVVSHLCHSGAAAVAFYSRLLSGNSCLIIVDKEPKTIV